MTLQASTPIALGRVLIIAIMGGVLGATQAIGAADRRPANHLRGGADQAVNTQAAALQEFGERLRGYLELRDSLSKKHKPLSPTVDAADLAARQESLAAALRAARKNAKPGDLIPPVVAKLIASAIEADYKRRSAAAERATFTEVPNARRPVINTTYPAQAALPTVPPLLLNELPRLPDNLQYRFYGRHVLILDGDVQIIVDYIANVLPPH